MPHPPPSRSLRQSRRANAATQARSAELTGLFERLAKTDEALRHGPEPISAFLDGVTPDRGTTGPPSTAAVVRPGAGFIAPNGRIIVLSASSRRLPPIFTEQAGLVRRTELLSTEVIATLRRLEEDFGRVRRTAPAETAGDGDAAVGAAGDGRGASGVFGASLLSRSGHHGGSQSTMLGHSRTIDEADDLTGRKARQAVEAERQMLLQRARAVAADEGASEDQSVADYAVDPVVPALQPGSRLRIGLEEALVSLTKCATSSAAMQRVEAEAPTTSAQPWWTSALRLRDVKAAAVRVGYHARRALLWSFRVREHLLYMAATLNTASATSRVELTTLQERRTLFQSRLAEGEQTLAHLDKEMVVLSTQLQSEKSRRLEQQAVLLQTAQAAALISCKDDNPLKAELALLLRERAWPSGALADDAKVVLQLLGNRTAPLV